LVDKTSFDDGTCRLRVDDEANPAPKVRKQNFEKKMKLGKWREVWRAARAPLGGRASRQHSNMLQIRTKIEP